MILGGPGEFETITGSWRRNWGEDITRVAAEAQKGYTKEGPFTAEDTKETDIFRTKLALRGLGNLRECEWAGGRLRLRLENPCLVPKRNTFSDENVERKNPLKPVTGTCRPSNRALIARGQAVYEVVRHRVREPV
jgi:hypothetical protein